MSFFYRRLSICGLQDTITELHMHRLKKMPIAMASALRKVRRVACRVEGQTDRQID